MNRLTWDEVRRHDAGFHFTLDGGRSYPYRGQGVTVPRLVDLVRSLARHAPEHRDQAGGAADRRCRGPRSPATATATVVLAAEHDTIMTMIRQVRARPPYQPRRRRGCRVPLCARARSHSDAAHGNGGVTDSSAFRRYRAGDGGQRRRRTRLWRRNARLDHQRSGRDGAAPRARMRRDRDRFSRPRAATSSTLSLRT